MDLRRFPRVSLAHLPTPLEPLERLAHDADRSDYRSLAWNLLGECLETLERLDDRLAVRLDEVAREPNPRFEERRIWVDAENLLPMRIEHVRRGQITMIARTVEVRTIQGIATPVRSVFERPLEKEVVTLIVDSVDYKSAIPRHYFSTLELIKER